jgi:fucose permease
MLGPFSSLDRVTRHLYVGMLVNFAIFGVSMTLVGATLPRLIRELGWSYTVSGAVLASSSVGYFLTTFVVGFLVHRVGSKPIMLAGLVMQALGLAFFARSPSPAVNMVLNFATGIGQGCAELVTNYGVMRMEREGESRLMNLLHAAFCVGGVVGPFAAGAYLGVSEGWGDAWRLIYPAVGVVAVGAFVMFTRLRFPPEVPHGAAAAAVARSRAGTPLLAIFDLMLALYVSAEIGFSSWASEYFVKVLGASASVGALMVSVLWLGILAGRLGLSFWFAGDRQDIAILILSVVSALAVLLLRTIGVVPVAALAVFLSGLGFSGVYPMVMTLVGRWFRSGRAVGVVATGGGLGSFAFPFLMGYVGQVAGIASSFLLCAAAVGVLSLLAAVVIAVRPRASAAPRAGRNTQK